MYVTHVFTDRRMCFVALVNNATRALVKSINVNNANLVQCGCMLCTLTQTRPCVEAGSERLGREGIKRLLDRSLHAAANAPRAVPRINEAGSEDFLHLFHPHISFDWD